MARCAVSDEPARIDVDLTAQALAAARNAVTAQPQQPIRSGSRRTRNQRSTQRSGYSAAGPDPRDPQLMQSLVGRLLTDRGWDRTIAAASVLARWDSLVGAELASRAKPVSLDNGELTLVADSAAWATQIRLLTTRLLSRIDVELGHGVVTSIRVHGPTGPVRTGRLRVQGSRDVQRY